MLDPALCVSVRSQLFGQPTGPVETATFRLTLRDLQPAHARCPVKLVANGNSVELGVVQHSVHDGRSRFQSEIEIAAITGMATAVRLVGGVCDTRFTLDEEHRALLQNFLMRFAEEQEFARPEPTQGPAQGSPQGTTL